MSSIRWRIGQPSLRAVRDLRHTAASILRLRGCQPKLNQDRPGGGPRRMLAQHGPATSYPGSSPISRIRDVRASPRPYRSSHHVWRAVRSQGSMVGPTCLLRPCCDLGSEPRIRLHDLRHTHATIALKAGVPIKVISERLGHENPAFTMKQYAHVIPGMQADAARVVASAVRDAMPESKVLA